MSFKLTCAAVVVAAVALATPLSANPIPIYGTGLDALFQFLSPSSIDPHYSLVVSPDISYPGPDALVVQSGFPLGDAWIANGPNSKWIAPRADAVNGNADGDYVYRTTFSLDGLDPATAILRGAWATDNAGLEIYLNGVATGNSIPFGTPGNYSFQQMTAFTIASGFVAGLNTLEFKLNNFPNNGNANPTAIRVDVSGEAAAPEPATIGLFVSGALLIVLRRFRRT